MVETASSVLLPWSSFYVLIGSSAAALTGLMFVVITLVMGLERRNKQDGLSTFSTPTVVHFCAALLASAILVAPWRSLIGPAVLLGVAGGCGVAYALRLMYRTKRVTGYEPDFEDWTWYTIVPFFAYGAIFAGGIVLVAVPLVGLVVLACGITSMVFLGIRNAWDVVTYIATQRNDESQ